MAYRFSLEFQKKILAAAIRDEGFLKGSAEVLKPEYFGDEILSGIAQCALDFWREHKESPTLEALQKEIKGRIAPGRQFHEYQDCARELYASKDTNSQYFQEQATDFARAQALANSLRESEAMLQEGNIDGIEALVRKAARYGEGLNDGVYDYFSESPERVRGYALNGHGPNLRLGCGISILDDAMNGGLGKGELGTIVALPGFGKSTTLVAFGARALLQGKSVFYVTLELSRAMISAKFDSNLFGLTIDKIKKAPREFARAFLDLKHKLTGKLSVMEQPTKSVGVDYIQAMAERLGKVDLILVDYGQLIKPVRARERETSELTEVYEALRRMAGEMQVPLWTAHQANRPGTNSKVIRMEHIAGDFNVAAISDICISVNHSEEEDAQGRLRFFVMKSRIGPSGLQAAATVNWKTARILGV